jgi:Zn-dependent protease with chaperone function
VTMSALPQVPIAATWFDGRTAAAHPVSVRIAGGCLSLQESDGALLRTARLERVQLSDPTARAPRFVYLEDGSTLEVHDTEPFNRVLDTLGKRPALVARLQHRAPVATVALALLVASFVLAYTHGVPLLARWIAFALPAGVEARLGEQFEQTLNLEMLAASRLTEDHQARLRALLGEAARRGAPGVAYELKSRATQTGEGINAFSLPGGTIVLLDGLVNATADETQVLAVLGHELGHVANKHGLRNILQALGIAAIASAAWGDFAGVTANIPVVFGALHYSRAFELEADRYAVDFLRANGLTAQPLIEFFESIAARGGDSQDTGPADIFSTHPPTRDRIERLKEM